MSEDLSDYTWKGDTWWGVGECPECGALRTSNGTVVMCSECESWEVI